MAASTLVPGLEIRYNAIRRVSESQSEASSIATEFSENDIAIRLGLPDTSVLQTVRFKVDRKKLEEMIQSENATTFFESLMKDTTTHIYWPSHLKIDAKSKKDVHVKILGELENIQTAKERVLEKLDARGSRVTMKMDISFNDHSSIIGTKGINIKKIMDDTKTHIHFPDSNKVSDKDKDNKEKGIHNNINKSFPPKSNQVSLNGTLEGVERARAAVRYTSPLSISFESPMSEHPKSDYTDEIKKIFDVKVVTKVNRQKLPSTTVLVKGTEKDACKTMEATKLLINCMCETYANQTKVCLQMEISTQHHESIKGPNGRNLRQIMDETNTTIIFPDCRDGNTPPSKKSHVTIKGSIQDVYIARQQLIGNLLVTLSFDYSDFSLNNVDIDGLSKKYGVGITCRDKNKQNSKSIVIKGKEKFIDKIYEARHELLKLTTPLIKADIPEAYFSKTDEFSYQNFITIPNRSDLHHFGLQMDAFQNMNMNMNINTSNMAQNNRQRIPQNNFHQNFLSPHATMNPRSSLSPTTSGYNSAHNSSHNSFNSSGSSAKDQVNRPMDQLSQINRSLDQLQVPRSLNCFGRQQSPNYFLDREIDETLFDDEKTPTLADVKKTFSFDQKKLEGYRAMKRALESDAIRTPTSAWAGLGLSSTSPFSLETVRKSNDWDSNDASPSVPHSHSPFGLVNTAGIIDATPSNLLGHHKDIQSLLIHLGLEHYINTFHIHEIDLELFSTLTPENLTTLGIQAFGARKKLLLAIHQLNASKRTMSRSTKFSGSAAPGAERRISGDW